MAITLGGLALDNASTVVREEYEAVGGKQTRAIRITGVVRGNGDLAALIEALDDIARSASESTPVAVSLRTGRRLFARREHFAREVNGRALVGQFVLDLRADDAWEESEAVTALEWNIGFSGAATAAVSNGNAAAAPVLELAAMDELVTPGVSDGVRAIRYKGTVPIGAILRIDGAARQVLLDGVDVTPYTTGDFPILQPGETTLTYTDDPASSHLVTAAVSFRDRWW